MRGKELCELASQYSLLNIKLFGNLSKCDIDIQNKAVILTGDEV
jgi:hypothetical protein